SFYASGMVIQTSPNTIIKGYADPGSVLAVRISDFIRLANADSAGTWKVVFPEIVLKKPFSLFIEGSDTIIELEQVTAGKVYVVAGDAFLNTLSVLNDPDCNLQDEPATGRIKVFKPRPSGFRSPATDFMKGEWLPSEKAMETTSGCKVIRLIHMFSHNRKETTGIIDLTWPGSGLESWLPDRYLSDSIPEKLTEKDARSVLRYNDSVFSAIRSMKDTCIDGVKKGVKRIWYNDELWRVTNLPVNLSKKTYDKKKRILYLRKKIYVSSRYLTSDFFIRLGNIHGQAEFYFNEFSIEDVTVIDGMTMLTIPDSIMHVWSNVLAVRFFLTDSLAGIYGNEFICSNADSTFYKDLSADWKYNHTMEVDFPQPVEIGNHPSAMYNGLLAPVIGHSCESFVWYGGINDLSSSSDRINELCGIIAVAGKKNNYIAFDVPEDHDTMVYGQLINQLNSNLKKIAGQCDDGSDTEVQVIEFDP
ncbi:MAG: hypothetical protein PVF73_10080, partial [Bacteroidales bacterium]